MLFRTLIGEVMAMPTPEIFAAGQIQHADPAIAGVAVDHQRTDEPPPAPPEMAGRPHKPDIIIKLGLFLRMPVCLRVLEADIFVTFDRRNHKTNTAGLFTVAAPIHPAPADTAVKVMMFVEEFYCDRFAFLDCPSA